MYVCMYVGRWECMYCDVLFPLTMVMVMMTMTIMLAETDFPRYQYVHTVAIVRYASMGNEENEK